MNTPNVVAGQNVLIIETYLGSDSWLQGAEFVADLDSSKDTIHVPGQGWIYCNEWEIILPPAHADRYTTPSSRADLEAMAQELENVKRDRDRHMKQIADMWNDRDKISNALNSEAADRDWCDEYNSFVSDLNTRLKYLTLELPTTQYEVTVRRTRTVYDEVTVIVEGPRGMDEEEIEQQAFEEASNSYDWYEVDDDVSDEYEIRDMREA